MDFDVVAEIFYFLEDDENADTYFSKVISHNNSLWFVPIWFLSNATGQQYPHRIVPLEKIPHEVLSNELIKLLMVMPKGFFEDVCPRELLQQYGVVEFDPLLSIYQAPGYTH